MRKYDLNVHIFQIKKTDVVQDLIDEFFSNFDCQRTLPYEGLKVKKKNRGTGLISEKTEGLQGELNKRAESATSGFSA